MPYYMGIFGVNTEQRTFTVYLILLSYLRVFCSSWVALLSRRRFGTLSSSSGVFEFVLRFSCAFVLCKLVLELLLNIRAVATEPRLAGKLAEKLLMACILDCWKDTETKSGVYVFTTYWLSESMKCQSQFVIRFGGTFQFVLLVALM